MKIFRREENYTPTTDKCDLCNDKIANVFVIAHSDHPDGYNSITTRIYSRGFCDDCASNDETAEEQMKFLISVEEL